MGASIAFLTGLAYAAPVVLAITLHEAAHGFVAARLGDPTASAMGRVSINPLRHVDMMGTIVLPGILFLLHVGILFGWAKPVPVAPHRLRNPRRDLALVAAAGPGANLLLAFASGLLLALFGAAPSAPDLLSRTLSLSIYVNMALALFNGLPVPPLDGGRMVAALLPERWAWVYGWTARWSLWALLGLVIASTLAAPLVGLELDPIDAVVWPTVEWLGTLIGKMTGATLVSPW